MLAVKAKLLRFGTGISAGLYLERESYACADRHKYNTFNLLCELSAGKNLLNDEQWGRSIRRDRREVLCLKGL